MAIPLRLLPRLLPLLSRHLAAYCELAGAEAAALAADLAQRLVAAALALLGAVASVALGCVWILSVYWSTPYRNWAIGTLLAVFVLLASAAALVAGRARRPEGVPFRRLKQEWRADQALMNELPGQEPGAVGGEA